MAEFVWDNSLEVGVETMDEEHKILIALMNDFYKQSATDASHQALLRSAETLWDYVVIHFADEERYMASINFPGLATHKQLHTHLLEELKTFLDVLKTNHTPESIESFGIFLNFWLATHIRGIDFRYGDYAKQR